MRVNSYLRSLFTPIAYRKITFDYTESKIMLIKKRREPFLDPQHVLRGLLVNNTTNAVICQAIRELEIHSSESRNLLGDSSKWDNLAQLICRLTRLEELVFDCLEPVPTTLLAVLRQHHPACRLHVRNWTRRSRDVKVGDPQEEDLARSPCLRSIQGVFGISSRRPMDLNEAAFLRIIALAPNIESASFRARTAGDTFNNAKMTEADREEEKQEVARFEVKSAKRKVLKRLEWYYVRPNSIKRLEGTIDLSKLEELDGVLFYCPGFRHAIENSTFSGIVHLAFTIPPMEVESHDERKSAVMGFICSLRPLQSLSIINYFEYIDMPTILQLHGSSLQSISLHEVESPDGTRSVLTSDQLNGIRTGAPNLESLTIDVNRTIREKDEKRVYAALSSFTSLTQITLYYDLGLQALRYPPGAGPPETSPAHAEPKSTFALQVWGALTGEGYSRLQRLILNFGEQNKRDLGIFPPDWVVYESNFARRRFEVGRNGRDDEGGISVVRHRDVMTDYEEDRKLEAEERLRSVNERVLRYFPPGSTFEQ
ncbi:hypothetical protein V5O48_000245 [Marasmius crinis-equi]|uniref:F-box domain-containing protein n=1 Tax=Marasmius crinis-equi TaxID=585013 RepID=A0ABR3G1Q1_9AGAR